MPHAATVPPTGLQRLELGSKKEHLIYVPQAYDHGKPVALALMLHGAGGNAAHGMSLLQDYADAYNIILVAAAAKEYSWDIIAENEFGADVLMLDEALKAAFTQFSINPARVAIGGFSDGASYALCIGLGNGELFTHILAFSPGFAHTLENRGVPQVFISHGVYDHVLPINSCSRRIVPQLQRRGIPVMYKEFDGEHIIPREIALSAVDWFAGGQQ